LSTYFTLHKIVSMKQGKNYCFALRERNIWLNRII
jgi:hypothetical protein